MAVILVLGLSGCANCNRADQGGRENPQGRSDKKRRLIRRTAPFAADDLLEKVISKAL